MPPRGPMPWEQMEKLKPEKPKNIKEVPDYLKKVIGGLFKRIFYIFALVWEAKPILVFVMAFMALFNGVMPVISAMISANLINVLASLFISGDRTLTVWDWAKTAIIPLGLQFLCFFINSLVNQISNMIVSISGEVVVNHIKVKIMHKAKEVDLASFDMPDFYSKLENANRESGMRPVHILSSTFSIVSTVISLISFITILAAISWIAPIAVIIMAVPNAIITFAFRKKNFNYTRWRSKERRQMAYYSDLIVNKDMVKEVKLFGLSDLIINRYKSIFNKYFGGIKKLIVTEGVWNIAISLLTTIFNCALFLFIAFSVYRNNLQIGDYTLYTGALNSISSLVGTFISLVSSIYEGSLFIENLIDYMSEKRRLAPTVGEGLPVKTNTGHTIELRNVSFRYPGFTKDVIKNISLKINAGDTLVMVGLNGAGKTTLIKLLTRLYDPTEGEILLDGVNIKEYNVEQLYKIYGIIFQDFGKYAVDVNENITFGDIDKEVSQEEIMNAAEAANATEFINKLPHKFETPLMRFFEDSGIELSIGQWQKLSIARAFYSSSDILILDEPTASLDAIAEQEVFSQFDKLRKDKTTIFVSHRLSSATVATNIIVLKEGELIESGNHAQLMKLKGHYYDLFSTQAKRYIENSEERIESNEGFENNPPKFDGMPDFSKMPKNGDFPKMNPNGNPPKMPPNGKPPKMPPNGEMPPWMSKQNDKEKDTTEETK